MMLHIHVAVWRHYSHEYLRVQEQSTKMKISDLQVQLRSSEVLIADLQKHAQQRDLELERIKSKVGTPCYESFTSQSHVTHHYC